MGDVRTHLDEIDERGFTIVEDAIDPAVVDDLVADLERLEAAYAITPSPNSFEGHHTVRIYNLLAYGRRYESIPVHPTILPIVEGVLDHGCLVSSLSSISILPGEVAQPIHADDQLIPLPKPHVTTVCNTMWALTDFTEANGATRVIPGSHRSDGNPAYGADFDSIAAEMRTGSVLIWNGSLWHGGGANTTNERRVGIAMNYCAGWVRQQENQQLGIPASVAAGFEPRLRELVGYSVYNGLIGHINKRSPADILDAIEGRALDASNATLWDKI